jgi:hypothetical protein
VEFQRDFDPGFEHGFTGKKSYEIQVDQRGKQETEEATAESA